MSGIKRNRDSSLEERVWRWLRKQKEPVKLVMVREHFHLDKAAASHCLRRLTWKGSAKRKGRTLAVTYQATTIPPFDLRGTAPGTLVVLDTHRHAPFKGRWFSPPP